MSKIIEDDKSTVAQKTAKPKKHCTYVGGQAVLEGVMMCGKTAMATAVRDSAGEIQIESVRINRSGGLKVARKIPLVRGAVNLFSSLIRGIKTLMRSSEVYGDGDEDEEPGRIQKWFIEKFKISLMDIVTVISLCIGIILAVGIFVFLPNFIVEKLCGAFPDVFLKDRLAGLWTGLVLGGIKFVVFIAYLTVILALHDIRRLYQYHGAEHKTINAYEHGVELTPEKVMECSRIHDRCGTSFLFIVIIINVIVFSVVSWACMVDTIEIGVLRFLARVGIEIVLLPVIAGISYEILKFLALFDNKFMAVFKAPGMLLQKLLTTREPNERMIEVAIAAFKKVLEMDADETVPETRFVTGGILSKMLEETKRVFADKDIDASDAEWIYSLSMGIPRSDLYRGERTVKLSESKVINGIIEKRLKGKPLWYIIGDTEFYGCKIKVDERALIPRPETELLADAVVRSVETGDKILDLCTGSGCIAVAVAKACENKGVSVTASDVSDAAIMLARENAQLNNVNVNFVVSDLFANLRGRFNIIVCNPPYIRTGEMAFLQREVREYEPYVALDGGDDGLDFYRAIAKNVKSFLTHDGMLIVECGEGQATEILNIFPKRDYAMVLKDLRGVERFVKIVF